MPLVGHLKFKVSERSLRDRLTLLQQKYKAKMRMEEAASGMDCEETKVDKTLEEILEKRGRPRMREACKMMTRKLKKQ